MTPTHLHGRWIVSALGIVQIFAWGSTYYLLAVLADPISSDTGWSRFTVMSGLSLGLLAAGLSAMQVGRLIQLHGGRLVMASAMVLLGVGLTVLAVSPNIPVYMSAWVLLGLGMGAGLYDAAFSTLGRIYGKQARPAISQLTLWAGFASTICWPISALLVDTLGWRGACLAYAAVNLIVTLPLCLFGIPRQPYATIADEKGLPTQSQMDSRFWVLATGGTILSLLATIFSVHLLSLLQAKGMSLATAVALGAMIGPSQVGARLVEMTLGARYHPVWTMLSATILIAIGIAGLNTGVPAAVLVVAYGAGNGIWSIARGALPLVLFPPENYALVMGRLAMPALLAAAVAPILGASMIDHLGPSQTIQMLGTLALVPVGCALALSSQSLGRPR